MHISQYSKVAVLLSLLLKTAAYPNAVEVEMEEDEEIDWETDAEVSPLRVLKLGDFSWKDCGGTFSAMTIKSLDISPDPIVTPGSLFVAAQLLLHSALDSPLTGAILMEKKIVDHFVKIPCIDEVGSCTYSGLCGLLEQVQCPGAVVKAGWNCRCPWAAGTYNMQKSEFDIMASIIPSGDYHIVANLTHNAKPGACLDVYVTFEG